jgi:hypothetical protein
MVGWVKLILTAAGVMVAPWALLVVLAARLPSGLLKDLAGSPARCCWRPGPGSRGCCSACSAPITHPGEPEARAMHLTDPRPGRTPPEPHRPPPCPALSGSSTEGLSGAMVIGEGGTDE